MGCAESKPDEEKKTKYPSSCNNYHTLNLQFIDKSVKKNLDCPMEALDFQFIKSLNDEKIYGPWAQKRITLDDKLRLQEDVNVQKFAETLLKQSNQGFQKHENSMRKSQGISKGESKQSFVGEKFLHDEVIKQLDKAQKDINRRQKKKGQALVDDPYSGINNLPRLYFRVWLELDYIQDLVKFRQLQAENQHDFKNEVNNLLTGAFSYVVSSCISKAQTLKDYTYDQKEQLLYVAGFIQSAEFKSLVNLTKPGQKNTSILLPGVTKGFADLSAAQSFLNNQNTSRSKKKIIKCLFQVSIEKCSVKPVSVKTFLQEDNETIDNVAIPDVVWQRLMLNVKGFKAVDVNSFDQSSNKSKFTKATQTVIDNPGGAFNSESYAYIFETECVDNKNDPGLIQTEKSYYN